MLCFPSDGERLFRSLRERPIRRYTEQFHVNDWDVDLCNFRVGALDRLADEVNRRATDNSLDARAFFHLARCAYYFIHGCRDHAADVVLNDLERMFG